LKFLNLPSLQYRRRRMDMILMFKIMNNLIDVSFEHLFTRCLGSKGPHDLKVQVNAHNYKIRRYYFSQQVIND